MSAISTACWDLSIQKEMLCPYSRFRQFLSSARGLEYLDFFRVVCTMKSVIHAMVILTSAVLPIVNAITPEGMLAAPRRGVALANPSGVGPVLAIQS